MITIGVHHGAATFTPTLAFAVDTWAMIAAALAASTCGVLGCFLVLRRLSLLGDAISHSILPGIAAAFLITQSRDVGPMLLGAAVAGLLAAVLSAALSRFARVYEDASLGVSFTTLFALGVILIAFAPQVDLDPSCVLYGFLETIPLYTTSIFGFEVPRFVRTIVIVLLVNTLLMALFWKELKLTTFDAALAASMGFSAAMVHYVLMAAVAWTSVVCFEAVGSILVVAMLIAPGATAHLLTDRYPRLFAYAAVLAASSAVIGYQLAVVFNTTAAGMISVVAGAQFALAALVAPRHGVLAKLWTRAALSIRIRGEDILAELYRRAELPPGGTTEALAASIRSTGEHPDALGGVGRGVLASLALSRLRRSGHVQRSGGGSLSLTPAGLDAGREIIRSHRMWESFLSEEAGLEADHLHDPSHRMEHFITPSMASKLERAYAARPDPHGKPVPEANDRANDPSA